MRIGICGHGLLGKALFESFSGFEDWVPIFLSNHFMRPVLSLATTAELSEYIVELGLDVIINASGPSNVSASLINPDYYIEEQLEQVARQIDAIKISGKKIHYVFCSSGAVYGRNDPIASKESDELNPQSPYAVGKALIEAYLNRQSIEFPENLEVTILRIFSVYSTEQNGRVLGLIASRMLEHKNFELFGMGGELRDFVHLGDFVNITKAIIMNPELDSYRLINVGTGEPLSMNSIVQIATDRYVDSFGTALDITFSRQKHEGNPPYMVADTKKMKEATNRYQCKSPALGLSEYFERFFNG
jgi:nucleoside-diphosphate-sugar epimerase